ncbi:DMT family transporter [Pseudomonas duriflava]|uniref:DMT family transporter n=1 Tax=Pseudomonas duriflava TaxID=459528 RepID=UPI0011A05F21|nr:DMT family transporter [Pseudomonas duriflava]
MTSRTLLLTALSLLAFAGNFLLCRLAFTQTSIDAASFTSLRLLSGAAMLALLLNLRQPKGRPAGRWSAAAALLLYAAGFSFAYLSLEAGTGALILFGAVQVTMIVYGLIQGERLNRWATLGLVLAVSGLIALLLPGATAPAFSGAALMLTAGVAWGVYTLLGRGVADPLAVTAGNFLRAALPAAILSLIMLGRLHGDVPGVLYALLSGAVTSGIGYALGYTALRGLGSLQAATVQLSVPVLTALAGSLLLDETLTLRLLLTSLPVLGGIALVLGAKRQ